MLPNVTGYLDDGRIAVLTQHPHRHGHPESGAGKIARLPGTPTPATA